jgi:hypothetical protein
VRGVLGNGIDVDVLMGMRPMAVNGNVGVELARVIQMKPPQKGLIFPQYPMLITLGKPSIINFSS